ncbi:unnamed protein product [Ilex paraguariensis]|uniref:Uncharacterized protein n=1 Tax=Ilex paraguariensis TaxID=185542 RepID=A0ABC8RAJ8_9AQUA
MSGWRSERYQQWEVGEREVGGHDGRRWGCRQRCQCSGRRNRRGRWLGKGSKEGLGEGVAVMEGEEGVGMAAGEGSSSSEIAGVSDESTLKRYGLAFKTWDFVRQLEPVRALAPPQHSENCVGGSDFSC